MTSQCRSCQAPIRWARTPKGARMPLDLEPVANGNIHLGWVGGDELAFVLTDQADIAGCQADGTPLYVSHFATCPDAPSHRKCRRGGTHVYARDGAHYDDGRCLKCGNPRPPIPAPMPGEPKKGPVICAEP